MHNANSLGEAPRVYKPQLRLCVIFDLPKAEQFNRLELYYNEMYRAYILFLIVIIDIT